MLRRWARTRKEAALTPAATSVADPIQSDDTNRVVVLARHRTVDGGFEIGPSYIGFGKGDAKLSVIVDDKVAARPDE
ncbi:MAG: hypothetical protein WA303_03700 [Bradyrhizobium sp.]